MTSRNKIAVLLALCNGEEWISSQIKSINEQIDVDLKLLISDDCSTDRSVEHLLAVKNKSNNHFDILFKNESSGSAAQNFFYLLKNIDIGQYDYIAFSDQDDIWDQDKLKSAIYSITNLNIDAYSSNVIAFWPDGKKKLIDKAQKQRDFDYMFESAGPGCTFVLTKNLAMDIQSHIIKHETQLENVALHDWFIYAFSRSRGYRWFIDPQSYMLYRQHGCNAVGANVGLSAKKIRWEKLREGWLLKQAILISTIVGYDQLWPMVRIKRFNYIDKCILALNAAKFRRRFRDQAVFAIALFFAKKP